MAITRAWGRGKNKFGRTPCPTHPCPQGWDSDLVKEGDPVAPVEAKKPPEVLAREKACPPGHWRTEELSLEELADSPGGHLQGCHGTHWASCWGASKTCQEASCMSVVELPGEPARRPTGWEAAAAETWTRWGSHTPAKHSLQEQEHRDTHGTRKKPPPAAVSLQWQSQLAKGKCLGGPAPGSQQGSEE